MTFDDEFHKLQQEIGNRFRDVRDHVILSVRGYSMWIAFLLMGITSLILVIGTLIVWYRHRNNTRTGKRESEIKGHNSKVKTRSENNNTVENGTIKSSGNTSGNTCLLNTSGKTSPVKSRIPVRSKVKQS